MHVFVVPLDAANAALVAVVVISLNAVVKEVAHAAKICGELHAAFIIHACVGHGLSVIARCAHHLFDGVPVHFVGLSFIVTVATHILFVAARRNQAASAHIVLASQRFFTVVVVVIVIIFVVHICSPI
jgi:hypothetical protein